MCAFTFAFATILACPLVALVQPAAHAAENAPMHVTAAMNDPARAADCGHHERRQMARAPTFSEVNPAHG